MKQNKKFIPYTTDKEFVDWLKKCDANTIFLPYSFALCYNLPREREDALELRLDVMRERAKELGHTHDEFMEAFNRFYAPYCAAEYPATYARKVIDEYCPALVPLTEVKTEAVPWLIEGALARGELALLGADGGTGKGLVEANIVASVTTGYSCPFLGGGAPDDPCGVLIFAGEDDPARVLRPRLLAAGADLSLVHVMTPELFYTEKHEVLTMDSPDFARYIAEFKPAPALIIIDPIQSFLPASVDMARRNEMRAALTPFKAVCAKVGAAGLIAMHTNKKSGVAGRQRLADSSDLWDMARAVFMMGRDPQQKGGVYLSNEKNNYSKPLQTALIQIISAEVEGAPTAEALLVGLSDKRDADFVQQKSQRAAVTKLAVQDAILDELNAAPSGCIKAEELKAKVMQGTGCSEATYNRARAELKGTNTIHHKKIRNSDNTDTWYVARY